MKISRAIMALQSIQVSHGDIEICLDTDQAYRDYDGSFIPVFGFITDEIYEGDENDESYKKKKIAVLEFHKMYIHEHE